MTSKYYTDLVEHYFRLGIRYKYSPNATTQKWINSVRNWIDTLEIRDRNLLISVFGGTSRYTDLTSLSLDDYITIRKLEKKFAMQATLIRNNKGENTHEKKL